MRLCSRHRRGARVLLCSVLVTLIGAISSPAQAASHGALAWGNNEFGELGNGTTKRSDMPVAVSGLTHGVSAVSGGGRHSLALLNNGTAIAWGWNFFGQLGDGTKENFRDLPVSVSGLSGATAVSAGLAHSLALLSNGTVMAWGFGELGQLGNGATKDSDVPVAVKELSGVTAISAGYEHSLALLSNRTVMAWGNNSSGQLGNGTTTKSDVPVSVSGLKEVTAISAGGEHSLALLSNGTVMAWGNNQRGQLGNGTTANSDVPVMTGALSGIAVAAGGEHSLALLSGGTVTAWGRNSEGQLGNGTKTDSRVPVAVPALTGVTALAAGEAHSLALLSGGTVMAWGRNAEGQLGNGTTTESSSPVAVSGLSGVTAISAGSNHSLAYSPPPPAVTAISPKEGPLSAGISVSVTGTDFSGATAVKFGSANATSFTVNSGGSITAVTPAGTGTVDLTVTTPAGTSATSAADQFTYRPVPTVTEVSPHEGPEAGGTAVTITGTSFTPASAVKFGSTAAASVKVNSTTSITATSPNGSGTVDVTVATAGGTSATSAADQFTYRPVPTVTNVTPKEGPQAGGTAVSITGTNFSGATAVRFGSTGVQSFKVESASSITAVSPAGTGTVDVTVTTAGGTSATSAADQFTYVPPPTVTGISPKEGPQSGGTSVSITGTDFSGATAVKFGSANASSFTVNSGGSITAVSPAGTGTVDVTVTTPAGTSATSAADQFTYRPVPTVTEVSPNEGPEAGSTSVTITGTSFTPASAVKFGSTAAASVKVSSTTSITATSPNGSGTVDVTVATAGGTSATSAADQFTYRPVPTVTNVTPKEGPQSGGTAVSITGTNFTPASAVKFGSTAAASVKVSSTTSITATSPNGSGTVDVTVATAGGTSATSAADQFTYRPVPTVTEVSPNEGPEAGSTSVSITGTNFTPASAVKFGSANATSFTVNSGGSITAVSPAGTGTVDVTVTTAGGTSATSAADQFTYRPVPTVTNVTPKEGPQSGGTAVSITGTNFTPASAVKFGSANATSFTVNSGGSITAVSPAGSGTVDVTVTTPGGTSATSTADQFSYATGPHYYVDNVLAGSAPLPIISWGTIALKTVLGGSGEVVCRSAAAGTIDNLAGGMGVGQTKVFATYHCESTSCPQGSSLTGEALPWLSHLVLSAGSIRSKREGVKLNLTCNTGTTESATKFVGSDEPSFQMGTSALHPAYLEFDAGAGALEGEGSGGAVLEKGEGEQKILGFQEQELISVRNP